LSARLKLTLSYAGFLMLAGALLLAAVWLFLNRVTHVGLILEPNYRYAVLREFAPTAAIVLAFLLVFGLVGGWLLAGRMLAPGSHHRRHTRTAATGSLSHRIRLPGRSDEFRELADAFDAMLARLEAHVAEQQRFAANVSHELRTPLAITQTLLDVARNDQNRGNDELDRLHFVNTRAIDLTIETSGDITPTIGSPALLLQMTTNLVHNAIVHNLPEQGTVWVTTGVHLNTVVLTVENTANSSPHSWSPRLSSRFSAAPRAFAPITQVAASAWPS
jgi:two-component system sensor histidine kinase VanS